MYEVFASNPDFVALRAEIADRTSGYDQEAVAEYCTLAMLDPDRTLLAIVDRVTAAPLGLVDFVEQSPSDLVPWIGLVIVHRSQQRRGIGTEAVTTLMDDLGETGYRVVRSAVVATNRAGLEFAGSLGFERYDTTSVADRDVSVQVLLMERALRAAGDDRRMPPTR